MKFCIDDSIGMDMAELERILDAALFSDKEEAWDGMEGTGADWKKGSWPSRVYELFGNCTTKKFE